MTAPPSPDHEVNWLAGRSHGSFGTTEIFDLGAVGSPPVPASALADADREPDEPGDQDDRRDPPQGVQGEHKADQHDGQYED